MSHNEIITENGILKLSDAKWDKARHRAEVIEPIAERDVVPRVIAVEAANKLNLPLDPIKGIFDD